MSQTWTIDEIIPETTSPYTDITKLTDSMESLRTIFSGDSEPTSTVAGMMWLDADDEILKVRNPDNSGWIFVTSLSENVIKVITTSYTTLVQDTGSIILADASDSNIVVTLIAAATAGEGSTLTIKKTDSGSYSVTLTPNASELIDTHSNYVLQVTDEVITLRSTGSNWVIVNQYLPTAVDIGGGNRTISVENDKMIYVINTSSGNKTVQLPAVANVNNGFSITVKKTDSSTFTVSIFTDGTETIDGSTTKILSAQNQSVVLVSDGVEWWIIGEVGA